MNHQWRLVVDTAAGISVGLADGDQPVEATHEPSSRRHVEACQPMIDELLARHRLTTADLDGIVVGIGPGPFTGLRIGMVTAATLGFVHGIAVKGVCTLDAIASTWAGAAQCPDGFVVTTDARRRELYWARYDARGVRQGEPRVGAPSGLPDVPTIGAGVGVYPEILAGRCPADAPEHLDAAALAASFDSLVDQGLEPVYLRKPDAELPTTRKSALASGRRRLPKIAGFSGVGRC